MDVPDDIYRYPYQCGAKALAARLGLPSDDWMQDWEYQVADPVHFQKWLAVYREADLSDDERFSLMMILVQCVEDLARRGAAPEEVERMPEWLTLASMLRSSMALHAHTVAYWACFDTAELDDCWALAVPMRRLWAAWEPKLGCVCP